MQTQCLPLNSSQTHPTDLFRTTETKSTSNRAARPVAPKHQAAHRRAEVRRSNLSVCHLIAAKHLPPTCSAQQKPNRRAVGRPGDARRPAALSRAGGRRRGLYLLFVVVCREDELVDSSAASLEHGCDRSQSFQYTCAGRIRSSRIDSEGENRAFAASRAKVDHVGGADVYPRVYVFRSSSGPTLNRIQMVKTRAPETTVERVE